jgi:hypothetical protein
MHLSLSDEVHTFNEQRKNSFYPMIKATKQDNDYFESQMDIETEMQM